MAELVVFGDEQGRGLGWGQIAERLGTTEASMTRLRAEWPQKYREYYAVAEQMYEREVGSRLRQSRVKSYDKMAAYAPAAPDVLSEVMHDDRQSGASRVRAAEVILDAVGVSGEAFRASMAMSETGLREMQERIAAMDRKELRAQGVWVEEKG